MSQPVVSIVIPAFNAAGTIERAIRSVLLQSHRALQLIIVDDCSDDDTVHTATQALSTTDIPFQIIENPTQSGPAGARNKGIAQSHGAYMAFLDADDEWHPQKLAKQVALFDAHPGMTLCGCQAMYVPADPSVAPYPLFDDLPEINADGVFELLWNGYISTPCAMVRRADLPNAPFDESLRVGEDRDLWLRLASKGAVGLVREPLVRIHLSSTSHMPSNVDAILSDTLPMIKRHIQALKPRLRFGMGLRAVGKIYADIGKMYCVEKRYIQGTAYLFMAIMRGHEPLKNANQIVQNFPVVRWLKSVLRQKKQRTQANPADG